MSRRTVSLSHELWIVVRAIQGARHLAESVTQSPGGADAAQRSAEVSALLAIVEGRLVMLENAITDEVNPALVWCRSNASTPEDEAPDVKLVEWSGKCAIRKARAELRRAKRCLQHERRERRS